MKKTVRLLPFFVFAAVLAGIAVVGIIQPDRTYSGVENRELAGMPRLTEKSFRKGKFQKKYETYLSDQFPARDAWVKMQTALQRVSGKRESNGVYFGKDGYLLEHYTAEEFEDRQVKKNIKELKRFVKKAGGMSDVRVMIVPSKTHVLHDRLPPFAESYDEEIFYERIKEALPQDVLVPVDEELARHADEEIYYRTDHHWTTLGAWYGYAAYRACKDGACADESGKGLRSAEEKRDFVTVTDRFYGTTHTKVNMAGQPDKIRIYEPVRAMTVVYNLGERTEDGFYDTDFLDEGQKDKYSVFFGGNQPLIEISGGVENGRTLLVIKDSFANCMIPFLAEDYERTVVTDLRQLNVGKTALLKKFEPTDVLVLYNTVQFMKDIEFAIKK